MFIVIFFVACVKDSWINTTVTSKILGFCLVYHGPMHDRDRLAKIWHTMCGPWWKAVKSYSTSNINQVTYCHFVPLWWSISSREQIHESCPAMSSWSLTTNKTAKITTGNGHVSWLFTPLRWPREQQWTSMSVGCHKNLQNIAGLAI